MSGVLSFVTSFCASAVLFGGLYLLKPTSATEKSVKYIFSLIFICSIISSFVNIKFNDMDLKRYINTASVSTDALIEENARLTFSKALENEKINFSKIIVCTDKSSSDSIVINKVIVFSSDSRNKISEALGGEAAEYEIEVVYE